MHIKHRQFPGSVLLRAGVVASLALVNAGCTISSGLRNEIDRGNVSVPGVEVVKVTPEVVLAGEAAVRSPASLPETLRTLGSDGDSYTYRLGIGDVMRVVVWEHPELNNPSGQAQGDNATAGRLVESDGTIYFPYVGNIKAAGRTVAEVRAEIAQKLGKFIREPQVDVRVTEFRSQRVYVTGEVGNPSAIFLTDTVHGVLDAITGAGGFTELSNRNRIQLTRAGVTTELPVGDLRHGDARANIRLQPGDLIHVPDVSDDKVFLLGEFITQKTLVRQRSELTLADALTEGGGLDKLGANAGAIFVFRRPTLSAEPKAAIAGEAATNDAVASALPKVYLLDLTQAESLLLAERFQLKPRDVVYIAATDFSKYNRLLAQLLPTVSAYFQLDRLINE